MNYRYFVAAVEGDFPWPERAVELSFAGDTYELVPPTHETLATIVLHVTQASASGAWGIERYDLDLAKVSRLLSALAWSFGRSLTVIAAVGGPNRKPWLRSQLIMTAPVARGLWLFEAVNDRQGRALALFREGLALEREFPATAFVAYFRAVEAALDEHKLGGLKPKIEALSVLLTKEESDMLAGEPLTKFLAVTRRHAFAHGAWENTHSPDDAARSRLVRASIPLVKRVAQMAMSKELGIPAMCGMVEAHRRNPLAPTPGWHELKLTPER